MKKFDNVTKHEITTALLTTLILMVIGAGIVLVCVALGG